MIQFLPGMQVSHFQLLEKLGAGATGEVFRAEDVFLQRPVAIKLLTRAETPEQQERFLREARLCSSLVHPHIAVVYEAGFHGSVPFLVMELVEGEMLSRRIRTGQVSRIQAILYMKQILDALEEAHARGIIHRDIKSSNIMITRKDLAKILDFGLAKNIAQPGSRITAPGTVIGTLEFLSPEQARGEDPDQRSDLFSAGIVLFHMLTGTLPFERETQIGTFSAILKEEAPVSGQFIEHLDIILKKALAKERKERYQNAREFLKDLNSLDLKATPQRVPATAEPLSLAVLYFEKADEAEETEYLRLGITEDIITDLSKVAGIHVLSRHAVQKYKDKALEIKEVLQNLQVRYLLQGKVQNIGARIRVTARLLDGISASPLWAEQYERRREDIFELQDEVARSIAGALQIRLTDSEQRSIRQKSTVHLQAYENYLKGRHHYNQATPEDNRLAEEKFSAALQIDPQFAGAFAGLSEVYVQRFYNWFDRDRIWLKKAEDILHKALVLNDSLPEVHCTFGMLLYLRGDYDKAMEEMQKSIRLDPHYAMAHDHTGEIYLHRGDLDKAILAFHTEMRINADVIYPYFYLVWIHGLLGDFHIAQDVLEQARRIHPQNPLLSVLQGNFASYSGNLDQAEEELQKAIRWNENNSFAMARLAVVYAKKERWKEALLMAETASEKIDPLDHHAAFDRGCVMSLTGNTQESLIWLNRAVDLGWRCYYHYEKEPDLNKVRETPQFNELLARLQSK